MNKATAALLGLALGDALGVPFEFKSAPEMAARPATTMIGYGTHQQPAGTWSDDSSLTFCLAASLLQGYDLADMAQRFIAWKERAYWTAHDQVFDIGRTTSRAIQRLKEILEDDELEDLKTRKNTAKEHQNGNGSLMRILPLLFYIQGQPVQQQFETIWEVSALTHPPIRAAMACFVYLKLAEKILSGQDKQAAYQATCQEVQALWEAIAFAPAERAHFERCIQHDIQQVPRAALRSGGYVIETLEASLWAFLTTNRFETAVFAAINLGHATDPTAAVTGGLAGLYYGYEGLPLVWVASLAKMEEIVALGEQLGALYPH